MITQFYNEAIAILMFRMVAGILVTFQAYDRIFKIGFARVAETFFSSPLGVTKNVSFMKAGIAISSIIEFACGILLILGLFKVIALYLLAMNLIFIAFVFSYVKPMWDMQFYFPRMILVVLLLFIPSHADVFSLDFLWNMYFN